MHFGILCIRAVIVCDQKETVDFGTNRKRVWDFLLILNSKFSTILPPFRYIRDFVRRKPLFHTPPVLWPKFRWQVTLCDPIRQATPCSSEMDSH